MRYRLVVESLHPPEDGYPERIVIGEGEVPDELIPQWIDTTSQIYPQPIKTKSTNEN